MAESSWPNPERLPHSDWSNHLGHSVTIGIATHEVQFGHGVRFLSSRGSPGIHGGSADKLLAARRKASKLGTGVERSRPWLRFTMCRCPPPAMTHRRVASNTS